jgi:hypothetical protein
MDENYVCPICNTVHNSSGCRRVDDRSKVTDMHDKMLAVRLRAERKAERERIVADLRARADEQMAKARGRMTDVRSLIAGALRTAADDYEHGKHEPKESGDGH